MHVKWICPRNSLLFFVERPMDDLCSTFLLAEYRGCRNCSSFFEEEEMRCSRLKEVQRVECGFQHLKKEGVVEVEQDL